MANNGPDIPAFVRNGSRHSLSGLTAIVGNPNRAPGELARLDEAGFNAWLVRGGNTGEEGGGGTVASTTPATIVVGIGDGYAWLHVQTDDEDLAEMLRRFLTREDPISVPSAASSDFVRAGSRHELFGFAAIVGVSNADAEPLADESGGFNFWLIKQVDTGEAGRPVPTSPANVRVGLGDDHAWIRINTFDPDLAVQLRRFFTER